MKKNRIGTGLSEEKEQGPSKQGAGRKSGGKNEPQDPPEKRCADDFLSRRLVSEGWGGARRTTKQGRGLKGQRKAEVFQSI